MEKVNHKIVTLLRRIMYEKNITQKQLAGVLGIGQPAVNKRLQTCKGFSLEDLDSLREVGIRVDIYLAQEEVI